MTIDHLEFDGDSHTSVSYFLGMTVLFGTRTSLYKFPIYLFAVLNAPQSVLCRLGGFELELELISDKRNELTIGGLALGVGYRIAEESLQGVQIPSVPGNLNGVPDGPFHSAGRGAEILGHLGVEHLGDGVACLTARWGASKRENLLRCL